MKIGILTLPLHVNYGGILQAYALQTVLERLGHDVQVINKEFKFKPMPRWRKPLSQVKRTLKKLLVDHSIIINADHFCAQESQLIQRFIHSYIHSYMTDSIQDVREGDFDAIVVGSDQIWRATFFYNDWSKDYSDAFLGFARKWDVKRYGYAISFGTDQWEFPLEHTPEYAVLAAKFAALSFREDTGVDLCRRYLQRDAVHVLDPTMLLMPEDYRQLASKAGVQESAGDLFCYILDPTPQKQRIIDCVAKRYGLRPFTAMLFRDGSMSERVVPPVEQWLRAFADAKMVVTDSFHGCAFSINFGLPLIAIGNVRRGLSRIESILRMFDITDHLLLDPDEDTVIPSPYLPDDLHQILTQQRQKSMQFLEQIK